MNPILSMVSSNMLNNNPIVRQFIQFANSFQGDPNQKIQELLQSGKVTQADVQRATAQAKQLEPIVRMFLK